MVEASTPHYSTGVIAARHTLLSTAIVVRHVRVAVCPNTARPLADIAAEILDGKWTIGTRKTPHRARSEDRCLSVVRPIRIGRCSPWIEATVGSARRLLPLR